MSEIKTTSLNELGPNLPIGETRGGRLIKPFELKTWGMDEEIQIGKCRGRTDLSMGLFVTEVLSVMLTSLGGEPFEDLSKAQKLLRICQLPAGDVLYIYSYLRREAMGNEVAMDIVCKGCPNKVTFPFVGDIDTLDVEIHEGDDPSELTKEVVLHRGMKIRGELRKVLTIIPPRWEVMQNLGSAATNEGTTKMKMIQNSVRCAEGLDQDIVLTEQEIKTLGKRDIEILSNAIGKYLYGPEFKVSGVHEDCQTEFTNELDWTYDSFFSASSQ